MRERSIAGWNAKVEALEGLTSWEIGQLQRGLHPPRLTAGQLRLEQDVGQVTLYEEKDEFLWGKKYDRWLSKAAMRDTEQTRSGR
jgi:hypothetical protein